MSNLTTVSPALPNSPDLLETVKQSCKEVTNSAGIDINQTTLRELIEAYTQSPGDSASSTSALCQPANVRDYALALPLRWDSLGAEVNFIALIALTSVLSPLQARLDELPASPSVPTSASLSRHLLLGLYLSASAANHTAALSPLSSNHLAALGDGEIAEILGLKIHEEKRVEHIPIATLAERGGAGSDVVIRLRQTLNYVGEKLMESQYIDMGTLVMETLTQCKTIAASKGETEAVGHFAHRLVSALPEALGDSATLSSLEDREIHFYKNALFLLLALSLRFSSTNISGSASPSNLPWVPPRHIFGLVSDGQLPAILARRGVFTLQADRGSAALRRLLEPPREPSDPNLGEPVELASVKLTFEEAHVLRAATIAVGERLREELRGETAAVIDFDAFVRRIDDADELGRRIDALRVNEAQIDAAGSW